jgi:hypothetical protein
MKLSNQSNALKLNIFSLKTRWVKITHPEIFWIRSEEIIKSENVPAGLMCFSISLYDIHSPCGNAALAELKTNLRMLTVKYD